MRDKKLPPLGIRLRDREGQKGGSKFDWNFVSDVSSFLEEKKQEALQKSQGGKKKKKKGGAQKKGGQSDKFKHHPLEYFSHQEGKYSLFDSAGIPTHFKDGKELNPKDRKKLTKFLAGYAKKYAKAHQNSTKDTKNAKQGQKGQKGQKEAQKGAQAPQRTPMGQEQAAFLSCVEGGAGLVGIYKCNSMK